MKQTAPLILLLLTLTTQSVMALDPKKPTESLPGLRNQIAGQLYAVPPDLTTCDPGLLTETEKQTLIQTVNEIRALHNLPPVTYDPALEPETRQAALLVAANRAMNHTPPKDYVCWTKEGRIGSWNSNLYYHLYSAWSPSWSKKNRTKRLREITSRMKRNLPGVRSMVATWMIDWRVSSLGHRRWLLDPFVHNVAFARVDYVERKGLRIDHVVGAAINVIDGSLESRHDVKPQFIAYPFGEYPGDMFEPDWYLSFSLLVTGKSSGLNEMVHFDAATVEMTDTEGNALFVYDRKSDNDGYGLPNVLMWKAADIQPEIEYRVHIRNVRIGNIPRSYSYSFRLKRPSASHAGHGRSQPE